MERITKREDLVALAKKLGVRGDWHEPDEQEVTVTVEGQSFDNAGFWPTGDRPMPPEIVEHHVTIIKEDKPVAVVNLATLFAWATGCDS